MSPRVGGSRWYVWAALVALGMAAAEAFGQGPRTSLGSAFTFQGRLTDGGSPVSATVDFEFRLFDDAAAGDMVSDLITRNDVLLADGLFTVELDFGLEAFSSQERFVEVSVRPGSSGGAYTKLLPRQRVTATPYALALPALRIQPGPQGPNVIGGFSENSADQGFGAATIAGGGTEGAPNRTLGPYATIGGGTGNEAGADFSLVGGGDGNKASNFASTVSGGQANRALSNYSTVGGGLLNFAGDANNPDADYSTVAGGHGNRSTGQYSTVAGGDGNNALDEGAAIGGGESNAVNGRNSTIGGGQLNSIVGTSSTIAGGDHNTITNDIATIGGGNQNRVTDDYATVGGGSHNEANGFTSVVPGGEANIANEDWTFAAGRRGKAMHRGAFVWADSTPNDFPSIADDEFAIRARGGMRLSVNSDPNEPIVIGQRFRDNAVVAWGRVENDALVAAFGISQAVHTSTGVWDFTVDVTAAIATSLVPVATAEIDTAPASAAALRIASVNIKSTRTFAVYTNNGVGTLVDNDFMFIVTAR